MSQALYRKYRSKKLSEIVGQEHITRTLERAIKSGRISHAYLFTGPKGVGKTSIARILAHEVNGLDYSDESIHLDIIEIDAASNRRIDEIRDLRDKVHIAPTSAKYKVYIIDEVHMLTKEAFNALLKTLEEPPAHVIFILATTEAHKLPETIVSRTQRYTFKPINRDDGSAHLRAIASSEHIDIDDDALVLLAEHGGGSFRDSISLLDQISNSGKKTISRKDVEAMLGIAPTDAIKKLFRAVVGGTPSDIVEQLQALREQGINPVQTAKQLQNLTRAGIIDDHDARATVLLDLSAALIAVSSSAQPDNSLELALIKTNLTLAPAATPEPIAQKAEMPASPVRDAKPAAPPELPAPKPTVITDPAINAWWPAVLSSVKQHNNTTYGVLRMAHPELTEDIVRLKFGFAFHKKQIDEAKNRTRVLECIKAVTGRDYELVTELDRSLKEQQSELNAMIVDPDPDPPVFEGAPSEEPGESTNALETITTIFGGGEVLES